MRIIQIMPAPQNLCAFYVDEEAELSYKPLVCLALVEHNTGISVRPMIVCELRGIVFADDYAEIEYLGYPEE